MSAAVTGLLILSSVLCLYVVVKRTMSDDVSLFGYRSFYVVSGSMEPEIPVGTTIIVKEHKENDYEVGDVITFSSKDGEIMGQPNTHRIIEVVEKNGERAYVTKGDANQTADPGDPVKFEDIYGKLVVNSDKIEWLGTLVAYLNTPAGFLIILIVPILLITVFVMKDLIKTYRKMLNQAAGVPAENDEGDGKKAGSDDESPESGENAEGHEHKN